MIHYPGVSGSLSSDAVGVLRRMHNDYLMNRGYTLGYGFGVSQAGEVFEIRGDQFTNAANLGDKVNKHVGWNNWSISILILVSRKDPANAAQVKATNELIDELERRKGGALNLLWHGVGQQTDCAGEGIIGQLKAGTIAAGLAGGEPHGPIDNKDHDDQDPIPDEEEDMKVIDFARNTPQFTRLVISGRIRWVRAQAAEVLEKMQVPAIEVQSDELVALFRTFGTSGPSPFEGTKTAPDPVLQDEWVKASLF